jgi:hypothetical protein
MWINSQNQLYFGDCTLGDREATPEEIAAWEVARSLAPPSLKMVGVEFEGVMCSATKNDQDGLVAVLVASQLQGENFQPTQFAFENGNQLLISNSNIQAFISAWMPFRQSFYLP